MILGIEGSPRRKGNSHLLLQAFMDGVQEAGTTRPAPDFKAG
jgi:multimeric flavodoxin WrbA